MSYCLLLIKIPNPDQKKIKKNKIKISNICEVSKMATSTYNYFIIT